MNTLLKSEHYEEALLMFLEQQKLNKVPSASQIARDLCDKYKITCTSSIERRVRKWLNPDLNVSLTNPTNTPKVLIYDIETSRIVVDTWWTGKQYIGHDQIMDEPKIITVAWKWLGDNTVYALTWDKNKSDKKLMKKFLKVYNDADLVIGQNNDNFDNRWINARAMKYDFDVNVHIKSLDLMKQAKRLFRLPSYSMSFITKFKGLESKMQHTGLQMWRDIQFGEKAVAKQALAHMVEYNKQDIVATEDMYLKLRKYMGHVAHLGVLKGCTKESCPTCGSSNIELYGTTVTPAGRIQRIMRCKDDNVTFKLSNTQYLKLQINE